MFQFVPKKFKNKSERFDDFQIFFTSSEHFCLLQAYQVSKQNFCIYKMFYQNENKTFALSLKFVVSKQNNTLDTRI